jgi:HEAT repeat protein
VKRFYAGAAFLLLALLVAGCGGKTKEEEAEDIVKAKGGDISEIKKLADKRGVPGLKILLKSDKQSVRLAAIGALAQMKGNTEAAKVLAEVASAAASDGKKAQDAYFAVRGLAVLGAPEAKAAIEKLFESQNPYLREGAVDSIAVYGDKELFPLIDKAISDPDANVQATAKSARRRLKIGE